MNPYPDKVILDLGQIRAVEKAVDSLPYGSMDPRAKEVEAQVIADYRKTKAANQQEQSVTISES